MELEPFLDRSVPETKANQVWTLSGGAFTGDTGKGVVIGVIDTGIDFRHDFFLAQTAPKQTRIHEIKFDGYRTQVHLRNGRPAIYTLRAYCELGKTSHHAPAWIELKDIAQPGSGRRRGIDGEKT